MKKPQVFIGSSKEACNVTRAIRQNLKEVATVLPWFNVINTPGEISIKEIIKLANQVDFSVFVFSPDDKLEIRNCETATVRDNVLLELGIFIGVLGLERCFIVKPNITMRLASDLSGVIHLEYDVEDFLVDIRAGVGDATDKIQEKINALSFLKNDISVSRELQNSFIKTPDPK